MNHSLSYTITLLTDAEIGSGLGNEVLNNIIARDHHGNPVIRGSHLKGLLRDALQRIGDPLDFPDKLYMLCFGRPGKEGDSGISSPIHISDATCAAAKSTRAITRNCLTPLGVVNAGMLRTTEAVPAGTVFKGTITLHPEEQTLPVVELALRLALLSLEAVGGNRNRGAGLCRVNIDGETRAPGAILKQLAKLVDKDFPSPQPRRASLPAPQAATPVVLRLIFHATDPVCCPETPVVSNNVIRSGIAIPASAVLGAIISRLALHSAELADRTMASPVTRAWPLLPAAEHSVYDNPAIPVRVSLSHRMSKLANDQGKHDFRDAAVQPYDWRMQESCAPLKGADGVLLRDANGSVALWRSGEMPRLISAHAVHYGERNLFTVEALAPMTFSGWLSLPKDAADILLASLEKNPTVTFGKARSIRGAGRLTAAPADFSTFANWHTTIFVLQSPLPLPPDADASTEPAEAILAKLVQLSGWGSLADASRPPHFLKTVTQAACAVRFGWNRHYIGTRVADSQQLRAQRVLLPGSVFVLQQPPTDLPALLIRGLGKPVNGDVEGRMHGFGAVLPHPGIATQRYQLAPSLPCFKSQPHGQWAYSWWQLTRDDSPSPSQISALAERIKAGRGDEAIQYLEHQRTGRPARVWERWSPVFKDVLEKLKSDPLTAQRALRTWRDLAIIHRDNNKER